jgi:hypothetical protein
VVPVSYHDFFSASATVAGALIGLLFVAISVSPEKIAGAKAVAEHQIRAAAAFSVLVDTLVIALVALLPGARLGPAVVTLAVAGLSSTAGLLILLYRKGWVRIRLGQAVLLLIPFVLYGLQLATGLALEGAHGSSQIGNLGGLSIGFFAFAIARAWELVGLRDSSLLAAMAGLAHQAANRDTGGTAADHDHDPPPEQ